MSWSGIRFVLDPIAQFVFQRGIQKRLQALKTAAEETNIVDRTGARETY